MDASGDAGPQMRNRVRELQKARCGYTLDVVNVGYGIRRLVRALQQGKIVLLLFDATVAPGGEHVTTPFLGRSLRVAKGVGWLSWRSGAPVPPMSVTSDRPGRYEVVMQQALAVGQEQDEGRHVATVLRALSAALERDVCARPDAWLKWKDFRAMAGDADSERTAPPSPAMPVCSTRGSS